MNLNMMRGAALVNLSEDSISKHKQYFDWTTYEFGDTYKLKTNYLSPGFGRSKEAITKDIKTDFLYHCTNKLLENASINGCKYNLLKIIIPNILYYEKDVDRIIFLMRKLISNPVEYKCVYHTVLNSIPNNSEKGCDYSRTYIRWWVINNVINEISISQYYSKCFDIDLQTLLDDDYYCPYMLGNCGTLDDRIKIVNNNLTSIFIACNDIYYQMNILKVLDYPYYNDRPYSLMRNFRSIFDTYDDAVIENFKTMCIEIQDEVYSDKEDIIFHILKSGKALKKMMQMINLISLNPNYSISIYDICHIVFCNTTIDVVNSRLKDNEFYYNVLFKICCDIIENGIEQGSLLTVTSDLFTGKFKHVFDALYYATNPLIPLCEHNLEQYKNSTYSIMDYVSEVLLTYGINLDDIGYSYYSIMDSAIKQYKIIHNIEE